jgi:hypothetical protein
MADEYDSLPKVNRNDLIKAKKYPYIFLGLFIDQYTDNEGKMIPNLNNSQHALLGFHYLDSSLNIGGENGFLLLIFYEDVKSIFERPFSKIIKKWGAKKTSRIAKKAENIYEEYKDIFEEIKAKVETFDEFIELSPKIADVVTLDKYYENCCELDIIKKYVENHITEFATIDENNTQISHIDKEIEEMETRERMIKETKIIDKYIEDHINELVTANENNTLVISASDIFGENNTLINCVNTEINGKRVTIEIQKGT